MAHKKTHGTDVREARPTIDQLIERMQQWNLAYYLVHVVGEREE